MCRCRLAGLRRRVEVCPTTLLGEAVFISFFMIMMREIGSLVEFTGPQYSMALSKLYTDTSGVMKRGVSESVRVPDTSVVKNQDKSWPGHVFCGVSRNIRVLILNDIS